MHINCVYVLNVWRNKRGCVIWILSYHCVACFKAQYSIATWIFYSRWTPIQLQCFEYASKLCFVYRCGTCLQPEVFAQNRYPTHGYIPRNVLYNETFQSNINADIFEKNNFYRSKITNDFVSQENYVLEYVNI